MILVIGLGNPGRKFTKTRHNLGFRVLNEFLEEKRFLKFKFKKEFQAEISEGKINNKKVILAKPQTFMNNSGQAVKSLIDSYKTTRTVLVVVHDDIDIPLGKIKIVKNRGSAGHRGVQSIINELGTKDFVRFRTGIRPKSSTFYAAALNIEKFVLQKFTKEEEKTLKGVIKRTCQAIEMTITRKAERAMSKFNK